MSKNKYKNENTDVEEVIIEAEDIETADETTEPEVEVEIIITDKPAETVETPADDNIVEIDLESVNIDGIDQVCMPGVETGKELVVAEHTLDSNLPALYEEDEISSAGWKKRVVVVTGASGGIGERTAQIFSLYADIVYNLSRTRQEDESINFIKCDVSKPEELRAAITKIYEKEGQIDVLVNNAGVGFSGTAEGATPEDIDYIFRVNFMGMANACACVIPYMRNQGRGRIINVASMAGIFPLPYQSLYSASKAAIISYTNAMRSEVAEFKIKVSAVLFNEIKTNFSDHRIRNKNDDKAYKYRLAKSVAKYEVNEQIGADPMVIARRIFKLSNQKNPRPMIIFGGKNKMRRFFARFMSTASINRKMMKKY